MKILILDDEEKRISNFRNALESHEVSVVKNAADAINMLKFDSFDYLFLDHDLENDSKFPMSTAHENTGSEVARFLQKNPNLIPEKIFIHSLNTEGRENIKKLIPKAIECPFAWLDIPIMNIPKEKKLHKLSWFETEQLISMLPVFSGKVWGIPSAGSIVAGIYCQTNKLKFAPNMESADIIIDDTVYRGRTYEKYKNIIDSKIFLAPIWYEKLGDLELKVNDINKFCVIKNPSNILLFPWENLNAVRKKPVIINY